MNIQRRTFLGTAAATGVGTLLGRNAAAADARPKSPLTPKRVATFKLSSQESVMAGRDLNEKLDTMEALGYVGIELRGKGLPDEVETYKKALAGRRVKVSAICGGFDGWLIADDPAIRQKARDSAKRILTAAGALGSTGLIAVPAFNSQKSLPHKEARNVLVESLKELGEHAVGAKTRILLEPLNRRECHFLRQVADGAAIAKDAASPGVAVMGDFWHMTWEETSDLGAFVSGGDYLHHVHMASRRRRRIPGMDRGDNYVLGFKGLKWIGYRDYVSLECGGPKKQDDRKAAIAKAAGLLREQWAQA